MWLLFFPLKLQYLHYTLETTVSLVVWLLKVYLGLSLPTYGIFIDLFCLCFVLSSSVMVHCHHSFCLSVLIKFTLCCHCLWKVNAESLDKLRRKWSLSPTKSGYTLLVFFFAVVSMVFIFAGQSKLKSESVNFGIIQLIQIWTEDNAHWLRTGVLFYSSVQWLSYFYCEPPRLWQRKEVLFNLCSTFIVIYILSLILKKIKVRDTSL